MDTLTPRWGAVWTRSRHEKLVRDHLVGKDIEVFLPLVERPSLRKDRRKMVEQPVFPGYLFARLTPYGPSTVEATRGVVQVLGPAPDRYSIVPDEQVEAVRTYGGKPPKGGSVPIPEAGHPSRGEARASDGTPRNSGR